MPLSNFRLFTAAEFTGYLRRTSFQRPIRFVQNHHTWKPSYRDFERHGDHMACMESMRHTHMRDRGWSDIGQNITIFPDGIVGLCRPIDSKPAGIFGANTGAICIESLGNFNRGEAHSDEMTEVQKAAIVEVNAALCLKFGLKPVAQQVVYHHWYDTAGHRFSEADINSGKVLRQQLQKTCPGTNFFCPPGVQGNTIQSARDHFFPLIAIRMIELSGLPVALPVPVTKKVVASSLNVRAGSGPGFAVLRRLPRNMEVQVFETSADNRWCKVSPNNEEWVSAQFLN